MNKKTEKITDILNAYRSGHRIPGMAAGVIQDGEVFYAQGFGSADLKTYRLFTADTLFALQDITSLFTAASLLQLQRQSNFSIDVPIQTYLPGFDSQEPKPLTARHILEHQTGFAEDIPIVSSLDSERSSWLNDIPAYKDGLEKAKELLAGTPFQTREDIAWGFSKLTRKYVPGCQTEYNIDPFLLAAITLEKITGKTWEEYVTSTIFKPLALENTRIHPDKAAENASNYYINAIDQPMETPAPCNPLGAPISAVFSTINDMLIFLQHGLQHAKKASVSPADTYPVYRQGWHIEVAVGKQVWSLSGNQLGGSSYIEMIPADSYGLVIFANIDMLRLPRVGKRIRNLLFQ